MILPVVLIVFTIVTLLAWSSWQAKRRLLLRIRTSWSHPRERKRDMEGISDFFLSNIEDADNLDDRTWNDLLMTDVFAHIDRTESTVGQQVLYGRLRSGPC